MHHRPDIAYTYDGTYEGFLCCVFESYYRRETPLHILGPDTDQLVLHELREIETDPQKAARVAEAVDKKISPEATNLLTLGFLTILEERECHMLRFIRLGFQAGRKVTHMLTDDRVAILINAVRHMTTEAYRFQQFIRFSDVGGVLAACIAPKNRVLPLMADHFSDRFPDEYIIIYDQTHRLALLIGRGEREIIPLEEFTLPPPGEGEALYRRLWRQFYDTIAIEGRINHRRRMGFMPKWYWKNMTELMDHGEKPPLLPQAETVVRALEGDNLPPFSPGENL